MYFSVIEETRARDGNRGVSGTEPGFAAIAEAATRIRGRVVATPLLPLSQIGRSLGQELLAKPEYLQPTGSFKVRGAANALLSLTPAERRAGVVAVSTGNHGRAVAYVARQLGIACTVCLSALVPENKRRAVALEGATVRQVGRSQDEAEVEARRLVDEQGLTFVHPFDDPAIIAGQGTAGLEIVEALPEVARVVVPLSGGGLIAGVALAVKQRCPKAQVVGVTMERGAARQASLAAGRPVEVAEEPSLADSLGGGIGLDNRHSFALVRALVDAAVLVSEAEIAMALRSLYRDEQVVCEGGAAVGIAALQAGRLPPVSGPTVVVLSGRNIDMATHHRLVGEGAA